MVSIWTRPKPSSGKWAGPTPSSVHGDSEREISDNRAKNPIPTGASPIHRDHFPISFHISPCRIGCAAI